MKKRCLPLLLLLLFLPLTARAAITEIADASALPASWADKPLLRLTMIDTDRSDAMLLECGGEAMLIDGGEGPCRDRLFDTLEKRGVTRLKYLLSSHSDDDHLHGLIHLIRSGAYEIGAFLTPNAETYRDKAGFHESAVRAIEKAAIPYIVIGAGDAFTLGDATLDILRCDEPWGANARSAASAIRFGDARVLSPGDIDNLTMDWYAAHYTVEQLDCDILKIPHHGLAHVPDAFLHATTPEMLIVPNTYASVLNEKRTFPDWVRLVFTGSICKYSGDGAVVCVTDGTDWYVWQEANWTGAK